MIDDLAPGSIVWGELDPATGREQGGRRPLVVVSSQDHLDIVTTLVSVVPVTTVDRGWPNHIELDAAAGLSQRSFAMTEQVRTISRGRVHAVGGSVSGATLRTIRMWINDFLND